LQEEEEEKEEEKKREKAIKHHIERAMKMSDANRA
jgi:hypothetical protein